VQGRWWQPSIKKQQMPSFPNRQESGGVIEKMDSRLRGNDEAPEERRELSVEEGIAKTLSRTSRNQKS